MGFKMKIQSVQSNYNSTHKPYFKAVIIEKSAEMVIEKMSEVERKEFNNLINRVYNTKFWDMRLSKVIGKSDEFWCDFVNKKNPKKVYKLGILPIESAGNKIEIYPIISQGNDKPEIIRFSSPQRAKAMMDIRKRHAQEMLACNYKSTNIQRLTRWSEMLGFLDEAYRYMKLGESYPYDGTIINKPSLWRKISDFLRLS